MTTLTNSFEGGTSGTTITALNSGGASGNAFDIVTTGASATNAFDNTRAAHGTLSRQEATGASSVQSLAEWSTSLTGSSITQVWYRLYLYHTANPAAQHRLFNVLNGATSVGSVLITTTGNIHVTDTAGNTKATSAAPVPLNAWYRMEGYFLTSAGGATGQVEIKLFTSSVDGTTPDDTQTSAANLSNSTAITAVRFGQSANQASVPAHWFDDLGASDSGYIGPAVASYTADTALTATAGVAAAATAQFGAGAALTATAGLAATATRAAACDTALTVTAAFAATAAVSSGTTADTALTVTAALSAAAAEAALGSAALTGTAALAAAAALAAKADAALTVTAALSATATAVAGGSVFLVIVADMQPATGANVPPQVVSRDVRSLSPSPDIILIPGDVANDGTTAEYGVFDQYYGATATSPSTNLFSLLKPVPGNHDHAPNGDPANTPTNLVAYDAYFGAQGSPSTTPPHFISFDTSNGWHIIGLDSGTQWIGSVANPSTTYTALASDLAANAGKPLIAFWHHPRWSDGTNTADPGGTGDTAELADIWNLLYDNHCDLVFTGHCHSYQRFPKLGKTGSADSAGIREFVVGSGGSGLFTLTGAGRADINSYQSAAYDQVNSKWFGYLKLWLTADSYSWEFVSQDAAGSEDPGAVLDSGGPVTSNIAAFAFTSLTVTAALSATATRGAAADTAVTVSAAVAATATRGAGCDTALTVTAALSATATVVTGAAAGAVLTVTAGLSATIVLAAQAGAVLPVTIGPVTTAVLAAQAGAVLPVTAILAAGGSLQAAFTVGTLTAADKPSAVLAAASAATAGTATLTASDTRTGGPGG